MTEALLAEPKRLASGEAYDFQEYKYVSRSLYLEQLNRYEELFPKEQYWC